MNHWSNIEISPQDSEIVEIDKFENTLGTLPEDIQKVRELIRRFELCHFKYKSHLKYIRDSIQSLSPNIEPTFIGAHHISKGVNVLSTDNTGRSKLGQKYLCSLKAWLGDTSQENLEYIDNELDQRIKEWLQNKSPAKEIVVRLLVARLMWNWESYNQYQRGEEYKELKFQVARIDICHYAFPKHIDLIIQGIGRMEPIDHFEGCGSFNSEIKEHLEQQFLILCKYIKHHSNKTSPDKRQQVKIWLTACLAKTLKEQAGLKLPLPPLN